MLRVVLRSPTAGPASPVHDGDFPDPFVLVAGDRYFAYGTQTGDVNVQVMESADLDRWEHRGDALPELPSWAGRGSTWAPAVLRARAARYVLYYAVRYEAAGRQCISVATASDPAGPFVDRSAEPLIFQEDRGGSIDPSPFVDADGAAYLLWKSDDNAARPHPEPVGRAAASRRARPWPASRSSCCATTPPGRSRWSRRRRWPGWATVVRAVLQRRLVGVGRLRHRLRHRSGAARPVPQGDRGRAVAGVGAGDGRARAAPRCSPTPDGGWHIAFHAWTPPRSATTTAAPGRCGSNGSTSTTGTRCCR